MKHMMSASDEMLAMRPPSGENLTLGARVGSPNSRKSALSVGFIRLIITTSTSYGTRARGVPVDARIVQRVPYPFHDNRTDFFRRRKVLHF